MSAVRKLESRLEREPRVTLARLPTPLRSAPKLTRELGWSGPGLYVKHDDETGFALGGNKVRKLEYALGPAVREGGYTHLITVGGPQSNHCRVTAAAAARLGLRCILVLNGEAPDPPTGNALLHRLFGAEIRTVVGREARSRGMEEATRAVEASGGRALPIPLGASTPRGALGYAAAAAELAREVDDLEDGADSTLVVLASSSAGTLGGLAAGFTLLERTDIRLLGVSADVPRSELLAQTRRLARGAMELLESPGEMTQGLVDATDEEVGAGYGVPTEASRAATELFARTEGVVLDPVYTAKAAAGCARLLREGGPGPGERVVFLHTGGHPALFA